SIFFFQAEDGIRDATVTGVQTCALPILAVKRLLDPTIGGYNRFLFDKLTRGLMLETAVKEFERQSAKLPNADPYALMRDIARDKIGRASCREGESMLVGGVYGYKQRLNE